MDSPPRAKGVYNRTSNVPQDNCTLSSKVDSPTLKIVYGNEADIKAKRFMNGRAKPGQAYEPTDLEHIANVVTHGLLIIPSLLGMCFMIYLSTNGHEYTTSVVYGMALMTLFSVSTVFHCICYSGRFSKEMKNFFHIGDRAVIYIFIAASYTPWLILRDFNGWGILTLWVVWICAILGIIFQYTFHEQHKWLSTLLYVIVGTAPSIVVLAGEDHNGIFEMAVGGAVYVSGVAFFKCDGLLPCAHAIWHCFVTIGAIVHFCAVCKYLLGLNHLMEVEMIS